MLGSGSMEEASLHSIPSHGHNYRGVVPLEKKKQSEKGIRHLAVIECPLYLRHSAEYFGREHNFYKGSYSQNYVFFQ